jgi:vitamin B12 transporter
LLQTSFEKVFSVRHLVPYILSIAAFTVVPDTLLARQAKPSSQADTLKTFQLKEIEVHAEREAKDDIKLKALHQTEIIDRKALDQLNAETVADAVRLMPGVLLKDYGGLGGLKLVSVRGLGSEQTSVSIDGIKVEDFQNAQIDLGKFSLRDVERIEFAIGGNASLLGPAERFASSSSLNAVTRMADPAKTFGSEVSLQSGSFGLFDAHLTTQVRLPQSLVQSGNAAISYEHTTATGDYAYTLHDGTLQLPGRRRNDDFASDQLDATLAATLGNTDATLKANYYNANRGLPNAALVGNAETSVQRLYDQDFFIQSKWTTTFSAVLKSQVAAKYAETRQRFTDTLPTRIDDAYLNKNAYASASLEYVPQRFLITAAAVDVGRGTLSTNESSLPDGLARNSVLTSLAAELNFSDEKNVLRKIIAEGNILYATYSDVGSKLTQSAAIGVKPFDDVDFRIRTSYREAFRVPTFNELYYSRFGNRNLKPETSDTYGIGVTYGLDKLGTLGNILAKVDGFWIDTQNKIIAVPSDGSLYGWSAQNKAAVRSQGIEVQVQARAFELVTFIVNYSYLEALDRSPDAALNGTYNKQLIYTPFETALAIMSVERGKFGTSVVVTYSGFRYDTADNSYAGLMPAYTLTDANISYKEKFEGLEAKIKLEANNIFGTDYEVIRSYPMPKQNFKLTLTVIY